MLGYGGRCPVGHYCPAGGVSAFPIPCDNGTYADEEGLDACKICPAGKLSSEMLTVLDLKTDYIGRFEKSVLNSRNR
jgi:hypothetical protein